ncbi:MAG: hypothetical protein QOJ16_310, partial [Acidobacteriota bacterium]|nr:hypothetical protein [Acidobacteriota bacterium]
MKSTETIAVLAVALAIGAGILLFWWLGLRRTGRRILE